MAALQPVITEAGLNAVWTTQNTGMQAEISHVVLGNGTWTAEEADPTTGILADITALRAEQTRVQIAGGKRVDPHTIHVASIVDDDTEFWVSELGFVLSDGTLFAVAVFPARPLAYKAMDVPLLLGLDLSLVALPADSVTVIAGAPDINLSMAREMAALATADIDNMRRILGLSLKVSELENMVLRLADDLADCDCGGGGTLVNTPVITGPANGQVGSPVTLSATATSNLAGGVIAQFEWTKPDGTKQTVAASNGTGTITLTISGVVGTSALVSVVAIDGAGNRSASASHAVAITGNGAPEVGNLNSTIPSSIRAGTTVNATVYGATDPEGQAVTYALTLPTGMTASKTSGIADNETFTLTAGASMTTGQSVTITVRAQDTAGGETSKGFTTLITASNSAPDMTNFVHNIPSSADLGTGTANAVFTGIQFSGATDPDGDAITYSLSLPNGFSASKITGIANGESITLTIDRATVAGNYSITITASDPAGATTSRMATVAVTTTPAANLPPDMTNFVHNIPSSMVEGTSANVSFSGATDPEGGTVTYTLVLPAHWSASKTTGILSGEIISLSVDQSATGDANIGAYGITIRAVDPQQNYSSRTITVTVTEAIVAPTVIGTAWQGGYYYGRINSGADVFGLVMSPKSSGEAGAMDWNAAMAFCDALTIGGYSDWVAPSKDELEIAYRNLKPLISDNYTTSGANANSIPPGSNYTLTDPAQTTVSSFQSGGAEAMEIVGDGDYQYWSSTYSGMQDNYFVQSFLNGFQGPNNTQFNVNAVRAIRRVKIN